MIDLNENFGLLDDDYLFSKIRKIKKYAENELNESKLIDMSIGDVKVPLDDVVIRALHKAVDEMAKIETFKGYSPEQGYEFLINAICEKYKEIGIDLQQSEVFVNDGAKSDLVNLLDVFSKNNVVGVFSISYPVYLDACRMKGLDVKFINCTEENNFLPLPSEVDGKNLDLIYLCSPGNPTGMVYNKNQLTQWVNYALKNGAVIIYDAAYKDFITEEEKPWSIYEISGALRCAIEVNSFSKSAGFTGLRCGYTIVPNSIEVLMRNNKVKLNKLWNRRRATGFNGASYIAQRGATEFLKSGSRRFVDHCLKNTETIRTYLNEYNFKYWGGINSPYIWLKCPCNMNSTQYFEYLIKEKNVVTTPGVGFGLNADGYIRISSFFGLCF